MDAKKLAAFANQGQPQLQKGQPGGGGKPHQEPEHDEGAEHEEDEGQPKFDHLKALLEQHAEDIEAAVEEMDPDLLSNYSEQLEAGDEQVLHESFGDLEDELKSEMEKTLKGVGYDDANELAEHLEGEGLVEDAHLVAGWLFRVGQMLEEGHEGGEHEEEEEEPEEEGGEEEEESEEGE